MRWYVPLLVGAVLMVDALVGERGLTAMLRARSEFEALEQALARARQDNAALREEARRLRDDPQAIEAVARRELGLIRPGETVFVIRDAAEK